MAAEKKQSRPRSKPQDPLPAAIEGLGVFYLGQKIDADRGTPTGEPVLVDAKRFTTHAVCVGMTGSGKTGLCLALLEEAAIDGVPAIVIDPKALGTQASFAEETLAFIDWIRKSPAAPGSEGVLLAGEPERAARAQRRREGVRVDDATWQEIVTAGGKVGVSV